MVKNIVVRIVVPIIIVFSIVLLSVLYTAYLYQLSHIERGTQANLDNISKVFVETMNLETQKTDAALEVLKQSQSIQQAWQARDREALLGLTRPMFDRLKDSKLVTHLYFIDLNKKVFLRVHNPEKYGDEILRKTLSNAIETGQSSKGLEYGIHHNFTLRNVHPWYVDGELIGYVEMGEEIADITGSLSRQLSAEIFFTFDKSLYSREEWERGVALYGHDSTWDDFEHSVVLGKTMDSIPVEIEQHLNHQGEEDNHYIFHIEIDEKQYAGGFVSVKNVQGEAVAKLVVMYDVTEDLRAGRLFMYWLSFISLCIGFGLMFTLYRYVRTIQGRLENNEKKLILSANNDALTGISNRRSFYASSEAILKTDGIGRYFAMIDIDDFKKINDQYGHNVGDECLKLFAKQTSKLIRKNDLFTRIGGEEFVLIMVDCTFEDVLSKLNLIRKVINESVITAEGTEFTMSVSIGLTTIEKSDADIDVCMKRADSALYEAKHSGKNCVKVFGEAN